MKPRLASPPSSDSTPAPAGFPDADELAALRAWYAGMT
ncbi:integrase, partial [Geobacillus sp. LEMMJ02]